MAGVARLSTRPLCGITRIPAVGMYAFQDVDFLSAEATDAHMHDRARLAELFMQGSAHQRGDEEKGDGLMRGGTSGHFKAEMPASCGGETSGHFKAETPT